MYTTEKCLQALITSIAGTNNINSKAYLTKSAKHYLAVDSLFSYGFEDKFQQKFS